jgi:hypothetical protein
MCCAASSVAFFFQVRGAAGRAESVVPDSGLDAGGARAALNHPVGILLTGSMRYGF